MMEARNKIKAGGELGEAKGTLSSPTGVHFLDMGFQFVKEVATPLLLNYIGSVYRRPWLIHTHIT